MKTRPEDGTSRSWLAALVGLAAVGIAASTAAAEHVWPDLFPTPAAVLGFESKYVEVEPGVSLHVVDRPGLDPELPPAVFVHGWPDSWRSFQRLFTILGVERRLLALDQRGFGQSSKPLNVRYRPELFAGDLRIMLLSLGIQEVGILVGHSMGSFVAWRFAGAWPEMVKHLVLIGTAPMLHGDAISAVSSMLAKQEAVTYDFTRTFQYSTFSNVSVAGSWYTETVVHESMQAPMEVWKTALAGLLAVSRVDAERWVPRISAPTMLIRGAADALMSGRDQEEMLGLLQSGTLHTVPAAGHSVQWEPLGVWAMARLLGPLLRGLDASSNSNGESRVGVEGEPPPLLLMME